MFAATTGGLAAWTLASSGVLVSGVVSLLMVIRQTRVEEQAGRRELLGSAVLGRHASLAAALAVVAAGNLVLGLVAALGLVGYGLPVAGSVAFGLVFALGGVVFAAVGAVAAQLVEAAGAARAIALAVMAALFAVAAVGEVSASGLVWASPFGWARRVQAFAGDRWWVLVPFAVLILVLVAAAFVLSARRDVGAGLVPARPGPACAPAWLHSPVALAWRLQRGAVLAWTVGFTLLGALLGAAMGSLGTQLDTPAFREFAAGLGGGSPADVFFRFILYVLAQVVAASMIAAALRLRGEETAGLARRPARGAGGPHAMGAGARRRDGGGAGRWRWRVSGWAPGWATARRCRSSGPRWPTSPRASCSRHWPSGSPAGRRGSRRR